MKPPTAEAPPAPQVLVVLGATGDLARHKLFPALDRLRQPDLLPRPFRIICSGRSAPDKRVHVHQTLRGAVEM
jgi:glucose-6-phosphate 1-dehydrogenase